MSGRKSTHWEWGQASYEGAMFERRRRLAEAARRDAEARRVLGLLTERSVRATAATYCPRLRMLAAALRRCEALADHPTRRAYAEHFVEGAELARAGEGAAGTAEELARLDGPNLLTRGVSVSSVELSGLGPLAQQLEACLAELRVITTREAPERQQDLAHRLGEAEAGIAAAAGVVADRDQIGKWEHELTALLSALADGEFDAVDAAVGALQLEIQGATAAAVARRHRYEERLAVLEALREAVRHLGYRELNPKALDRATADPEATWELRVDTRGQGAITFLVGEEQISAETRLGVRTTGTDGDRCFAAFAQIEERLSSEHQLHTEFRSTEQPPVPRPSSTTGSARPIHRGASPSRQAAR